MGNRYLVTEVQLGMLVAIENLEERKKIFNDIIDKQFVVQTENDIEFDVESVEEFYARFGS